jgi:K+/H+ antiporter YhaU regulatory subunit KhtT
MEDALAVIGQWIGLIKAAKFAVAEVSRDCEERVAAGTVTMEEDFQEAVDSIFEALSTLQVRLEEQEQTLEEELEEEEDV